MARTSRSHGFSLIELLLVLLLLGLIFSLVVPSIIGRSESAKHDIARSQVERLSMAVETYYLDTGKIPREIQALVEKPGDAPNWNGEYVKESLLTDPWGNEYQYRAPGEHGEFDIYSYGRDGQAGGEGSSADVTSWD